jgi:NADH dehydrogenase [ubiquinone] 1 alpha subcomplex assembly factor 7
MLKEILIQTIKKEGPLDLYTYLTLCQTHPDYGYYTSKKPDAVLGENGDFITAPEVSSLFGEMIAFWVFTQWEYIGRPEILNLVELGPGSGVLMHDILQTLKKISLFTARCQVYFVEINSSFKQLQYEKNYSLADIYHYESLEFLHDLKQAVLVIANEFFDALPINQYKYHAGRWCKVGVDISNQAELQLIYIPDDIRPVALECQPDTDLIVRKICTHMSEYGGAALIIDYGYWDGEDNTLQAVYQHQKVDILDRPGEADISVHVNFQNITKHCKYSNLEYKFQAQRQFLLDFGIQLRVKQLYHSMDVHQADRMYQSVQRLIDPDQMGYLFKVLHIWKM